MRWALVWLGIGFLIKWIKECWTGICQRLRQRWNRVVEFMKEATSKWYDFSTLLLSFALVYLSFAVLHVTTWQAFLIFLFWSFIILMLRVE